MSASVVAPFTASNRSKVASLYKRALKLSRDWTVQRDQWRLEAMDIRRRFEDNKNVRNPRLLESLLDKASAELQMKKHPDPYIVPTAPGGSKVRFLSLHGAWPQTDVLLVGEELETHDTQGRPAVRALIGLGSV